METQSELEAPPVAEAAPTPRAPRKQRSAGGPTPAAEPAQPIRRSVAIPDAYECDDRGVLPYLAAHDGVVEGLIAAAPVIQQHYGGDVRLELRMSAYADDEALLVLVHRAVARLTKRSVDSAVRGFVDLCDDIEHTVWAADLAMRDVILRLVPRCDASE
jgi:hypothetical protein